MAEQDSKSNPKTFDDQRKEIFADRRLAIHYLDLVGRFDGLLTESKANISGNIERNDGNLSKGLAVASSASSSIPLIGSAIQLFLSANSKLAGYLHGKDIAHDQENVLGLVGDAGEKEWATFARELAASLTLNNAEKIKSSTKSVDGAEAHKFKSVNKDGRTEIQKMAKEDFNKALELISKSEFPELDGGINIGNEKFKLSLISQITDANQVGKEGYKSLLPQREKIEKNPDLSKLAQEAVQPTNPAPDHDAVVAKYTHPSSAQNTPSSISR